MERIVGIECLMSLFNIYIILTRLFSGRLKRKILCIIFSIIVLPTVILSFLFNEKLLGGTAGFLCYALIIIVPILTVSDLKKSYILYSSLFYMGASSALIFSSIWIARSLGLSEFVFIVIDISFHCIFFIVLLLVSKNIIFLKFPRQLELLPRYLKIILLVFIWGSVSLAYFLSSFFYDYPYSPRLALIQCLAASLIILFGLVWPILIASSMTNLHYKNTVNDVERQMDEQVRRYEQLIKTNTEIRKFRHDYKNLILGLTGFLKEDDAKSALQYLEQFNTPIASEYILYETGNPVADALLSEKNAIALSINAKIVFDGIVPNTLISHTDICIILGNALDNALEACAKLPADKEKTILLTSDFNNSFLFLKIENPVLEDVKVINNSIETTKQDKEMHGIGMYSISRTIQKYHGSITLLCENKVFSIEMYLDLNDLV